jgi:CheY-like chemotaxis protein
MTKKKILIVEDNPMNMELFSDLLEAEGYSILQAVNGKEGLNIAKSETPDLVLLDPGLPDVNPIEIIKKFKQNPKTKEIILVVCTASVMEEEKKSIIAAGCDEFIKKPIDTREFPKIINEFLGRQKQRP